MLQLTIIVLFASIIICSLMAFNNRTFFYKYMFSESEILYNKQYYRLFSSGFIHSSYLHLFFNLLTLYFFYDTPLSILGEISFLTIYFGGLFVSSLYTLYFHRQNYNYTAVGASGAISSIVFSSIILNPDLSLFIIPIPIPIPGWVFAIVYLGYSYWASHNNNSMIGHSSHIGGAAFGVIITLVLKPSILVNYPIFSSLIMVAVIIIGVIEFLKRKKS